MSGRGVKKTRHVFYGGNSANLCAYCWKHKLYLTPHQVKKRRCLKRKCGRLQKLPHPTWVYRPGGNEVISRKARLEAMYNEMVGKRKDLEVQS